MRHLFDVFNQRINMSKTSAISMAAALIAVVSIGMILDAGPKVAVLISDAFATRNAIAIFKTENASVIPTAKGVAVLAQIESAAVIPQTKISVATPQAENAEIPHIKIAAAIPQTENAEILQTNNPASATLTENPTTISYSRGATNIPDNNGKTIPQTKNVAKIIREKLASNWQDWKYCLAPSYTEHKVYLSEPIPARDIVASIDSVFDQTLNKAGLRHDVIQCPKAPNKPTLLLWQKTAIRFNDKIGNRTIAVNWVLDGD